MSLLSLSDFQSNQYQEITWRKIYQSCSNMYFEFIKQIACEVKHACKTIFEYTYEHLSNRSYDHVPLVDLPVIQDDFAKIEILIQKLNVIYSIAQSASDIIYFLSIAIDILSRLSVLAGARSILKNQSVELLYHLKLFQKSMSAEEFQNPSVELRGMIY